MTHFLEIRTLSFITGIVSFILFLTMSYVYITRKTYPGFREWVLAFFATFIGFILISLRGIFPDFFSIVIANLLVFSNMVFIHYGLVAFTGGKQRMGMHIFSLAFLIATLLYFTYAAPNVNVRIIIISGFTAFYSILCIQLVYKRIPFILKDSNWLLIVVFSLLAFCYTLRFLFTLFIESKISDFMEAGTIHGLTIFITLAVSILTALGLIIVNLQRVEHDFLMAKDEVKILKGFLPICASCKKIRDDKGYWTQIEAYIREHSEAEFSHGICPECMKKLYPDTDE